MYDLDGDGYIANEELLAILHMMVGANISQEQVRKINEKRKSYKGKNFIFKIVFKIFFLMRENIFKF